MNGLLQAHPPTISYGVIGCSMYENENSILCCVAKDDWGFGDVGVIDDSIVFVQRKLAFKEGALNVFNVGDSENKVYNISILHQSTYDFSVGAFFVLCGSNFDAAPQTARIFRHSEERSFGFPSQITHRETHGETSKKTLAGAAVR